MEKNSSDQMGVLYDLLEKGLMSYNQFFNWVSDQFSDVGTPAWIEKAIKVLDVEEAKYLIRDTFYDLKDLSIDERFGQLVYFYRKQNASLYHAVRSLYWLADFDTKRNEDIYLMDDFYDWHDDPDTMVRPIFEKFSNKYLPKYELLVCKFEPFIDFEKTEFKNISF